MVGWIEFALALTAFVVAHVLPVRLRGPLTRMIGRKAYLLGYSLLSLLLLYWLIGAAGRAPVIQIWAQAGWMRWLVNLAVPVAILLGVSGGARGLMAGFVLWAGAHLLANGDLAHVILFGSLLAYALAAMVPTGLAGVTWRITLSRVILGAVLWAGLYYLHPLLTGASPLP